MAKKITAIVSGIGKINLVNMKLDKSNIPEAAADNLS